jgi:hypothetical protein
MDGAFYPGNNKVKGVEPFLTAMTGAKGFIFCFCQQLDNVLSLMPNARVEGSDCAGCNDVL